MNLINSIIIIVISNTEKHRLYICTSRSFTITVNHTKLDNVFDFLIELHFFVNLIYHASEHAIPYSQMHRHLKLCVVLLYLHANQELCESASL